MSKNVKRLIVATIILLVGAVLIVSGTVEINFLNLLNWFKDLGKGIWARLAPIIPIREIVSFIAGYFVALLIVRRKK